MIKIFKNKQIDKKTAKRIIFHNSSRSLLGCFSTLCFQILSHSLKRKLYLLHCLHNFIIFNFQMKLYYLLLHLINQAFAFRTFLLRLLPLLHLTFLLYSIFFCLLLQFLQGYIFIHNVVFK